jgi:hypothetical protein
MLQNSLNFPSITTIDNTYDNSDDLMCEIGKVLQAAVINKSFREKLLSNPMQSIEAGYFGEAFHLPAELLNNISLIKSSSLEHFSQAVLLMVNSIKISEMAEISSFYTAR